MNIDALVPRHIRERAAYPPGKPIEELEREYGISDSIKLASNENPVGPSPRAVAALRAAVAQVHRYPDGGGFYLRRALGRHLEVDPGQIMLGNGSNELIELIVRTCLRPGDEVVVAEQAFVIYRMVAEIHGASVLAVPLRDFTHDLPAMAQACTARTRVIFLANPNNPTGTMFGRVAWRDFLAAVPDDVLVVVDEAYAEFVADPDYPDSLAALAEGRSLVILRTFSKIHGLAGLRIGYGLAPAELVGAINRVRAPFNVNALAQAAALAALEDVEHVERSRRVTHEGLALLSAECRKLGLEVVPSQANFLLVRVGDGRAVYESLLRAGVIVRPMGFYGLPEYLRVTVGLAEENARFVSALATVLAAREST